MVSYLEIKQVRAGRCGRVDVCASRYQKSKVEGMVYHINKEV